MDNRFYDNVVAEMEGFFKDNNFSKQDDNSYMGDTKSVKIEYSEPRQMYLLLTAPVDENGVGEFAESSAWLFDDSQNAKDAASVGIDFTSSLRQELGIKIKRAVDANAIDLPSANKDSAGNITFFTKKVLDIYPQFKDQYKEHIAEKGNFLYITFFAETLIPQIKEVLKENNKKQLKKLFELLDESYIQGNRETVNIVVAVLAAATYKDADLKEKATLLLSENKHFQNSYTTFIPTFEKNKKLVKAFIKQV